MPNKPLSSGPRETRDEKLEKKKMQASAKVQRLCEDVIRSIGGFHPLLKVRVKRSFESLLRSIELCTNFNEIDDYVEEAEDFDLYDLD